MFRRGKIFCDIHAHKQDHNLYRHLDDKCIYFSHVLLLHSEGKTVFQNTLLLPLKTTIFHEKLNLCLKNNNLFPLYHHILGNFLLPSLDHS